MPMPAPTTDLERELRKAHSKCAVGSKKLPAGHPERLEANRRMRVLKALVNLENALAETPITAAERARFFDLIANTPVIPEPEIETVAA